ncbi:hypothetical protein RRF68_09505 [Tenacibaculum sp. HL-MS23]|uniref:hypothetical protein n=1 Tax=unclassified Tenacibaculum TaxID=2635139 RepID=UPI001C4EDA0E|nr:MULTISPECIES: hypothetical protein [unclassified Tenacibaculum]QXP73181.1 hypothetical protein H0I30_10905 [Tenacibaculum sp. AHE14PA]QXP77094.1 hypothetical protein H0I31_05645 [Tenacibaculum sp. AHE15PA]WNW01229.1 hypothetical protein RRF68_09505 [Tenacibaculum sp. HL-MS23]
MIYSKDKLITKIGNKENFKSTIIIVNNITVIQNISKIDNRISFNLDKLLKGIYYLINILGFFKLYEFLNLQDLF